MRHHYEAVFRIDLGKAIPSVGELFDGVNNHLSAMGVQERLGAYAEAFRLSVSVDRKLTPEEEHRMSVLLEEEVLKSFPKYDVRLASFRSQPVTSEQSAG